MGIYVVMMSGGSTIGNFCGGFMMQRESTYFLTGQAMLASVRLWFEMDQMGQCDTYRSEFPDDRTSIAGNSIPS